MSTTREKYVAKCWEVRKAEPVYQNGASSLKECDCIGMTKYGLRENGVKFSTTGTNWTIRNQVDNVRDIHSVSDLHVGDVVFKALNPGDSGYNLPAKYQPGGSGYNGDLTDYNHIGTVASVNQLQIIHMTGPTAKTDTKIGKWKKVASLKKEYISDGPEPSPDPGPDPEPSPEPTPVSKTMYVYAANGKPVNMRTKPSKQAALVERVPVGASVIWQKANGEGWAYVKYHGFVGWMMEEFLTDDPQPAPAPDPEPTPAPEPSPEPEPPIVIDEATVWAENGKPVKMRAEPSQKCKLYDEVPVGTVVAVDAYNATTDAQGNPWSKVSYGSRKGWYIMTRFLGLG